MSLSAYEALQQETPVYERNSSDEELEEEDTTTTRPSVESGYVDLLNQEEDSKYINSNFTPDEDNLIFGKDYVIFGLKSNQNLIIKGQFILKIQRGAILINNVLYHSSNGPMKFINSVSNALPLIQAAQVQDIEKVNDTQNEENKHLFTSEYKSVIRLSNWQTSLDNIGNICPILKQVFWNFKSTFSNNESLKQLNQYQLAFNDSTFFPILKPDNSITVLKLSKNPTWLQLISKLNDLYNNNQLLKILVIGGKNSGKSTLLRLILQNFLNSDNCSNLQPINYLDLDPGQTEFSKPDSISLSKHIENQFGNHLSLTEPFRSINHYIGFNSPKDQPKRYNKLITELINDYKNDSLLKNEALLINTPGWIKGYGIDLTNSLIDQIKPTHLIYLNNGNIELEEFKIPSETEIIPILGNYQNTSISKYSSSQLRMLKKISYFHKISNDNYDFTPLINNPPLQISYGSNGIKAISFWNEEINLDLIETKDYSNIKNSIEGTIMALHIIKSDKLSKLNIVNSKQIPIVESLTENIEFKALTLIHSIDEKNKLINLYIPPFEDLSKPNNYEYVLIRSNTDTPIWEIYYKTIIKDFNKDIIPFLAFDKPNELDKTWKIRKNVQRRGQQ